MHKEGKNKISWSDFEKIDMRCGTIVEVHDFPEARKPAYKVIVDFGSQIGRLKSSAQITSLYTKDDLLGRQVMAIVNFPPKQIGPFISECLLCGFYTKDGVVLAQPDRKIENGAVLG